MTKYWTFIVSLLLLLGISGYAKAAAFQCLLVSIEKYELAPLDFAEGDVGQLAQTLMNRYDCLAQACIDTVTTVGDTGEVAAQKSIMRKIETWCKSLGAEDNAVLYLAGHGVKDENGKLYLAMINFNRKNFETAAIPLEWIREQFGKCGGKNKLLLIDTCFAGESKSVDFEQANSGDVSGSFAELKNVVTIASCRENEKSWLWGDAKHSLFTYWLIEAFKGHADADGDRIVTCDEIVRYLQDNVSWTAAAALEKEQHPVVLNEKAGADFQLPLRAVTLSRLIDDVAEQIDLQMRIEKFMQIGIPEFTSGSERTMNPHYGALPRNIADSLRKALVVKAKKNKSGYAVFSENALRETLQSKGITPSDLGTEKTKNMKVGGEEIPLLVDGQLNMFGTAGILLRTNLLDTKGKSEIAQAGGAALLNNSELAMSGISAKFTVSQETPTSSPQQQQQLKPEPGVGLVSPQQLENAERMRNAAVAVHPLANVTSSSNTTDDRFNVWIETRLTGSNRNYVKRPFVFQGNDCYLPVSKGEEYQIRFQVFSKEETFLKILVDGLNTLSQRQNTVSKGAYIEAVDTNSDNENSGEMVIAPRVLLEEARPWYIHGETNQAYAIAGFVDANGKSDTMRRFRIVDADQSVAAQKNYAEQLGLITVAFYKAATPKEGSRGKVGTDMGNAERVQLERYKGGKIPSELLAVYNIRYMTPETLKELGVTKK
ncbi:MAG: caspase family protein [Planctomycetaceae bacterium]|jgi:hypothetical protein|nr:caspase family protein [Planctomycetaceae bacterium]